MRIGQLRKRIVIQAESPTPDGAGGYTLGWTDIGIFWGEIGPAAGREVFAAQHLEGHVTHKITLRWQSGVTITTDMRAAYNGRVFNILAVLNTGEINRWWELLAEEGTAV